MCSDKVYSREKRSCIRLYSPVAVCAVMQCAAERRGPVSDCTAEQDSADLQEIHSRLPPLTAAQSRNHQRLGPCQKHHHQTFSHEQSTCITQGKQRETALLFFTTSAIVCTQLTHIQWIVQLFKPAWMSMVFMSLCNHSISKADALYAYINALPSATLDWKKTSYWTCWENTTQRAIPAPQKGWSRQEIGHQTENLCGLGILPAIIEQVHRKQQHWQSSPSLKAQPTLVPSISAWSVLLCHATGVGA